MFLTCGAGEDSWESLGLQGDQTKGNQSWIFIVRTDAEAPMLWPPDAKNWLLRKYPDAGKDWRQKKSVAEMKFLDGITGSMGMNLANSRSWWSLACCSPWGRRVKHDLITEQQGNFIGVLCLSDKTQVYSYPDLRYKLACWAPSNMNRRGQIVGSKTVHYPAFSPPKFACPSRGWSYGSCLCVKWREPFFSMLSLLFFPSCLKSNVL